jgi:Zn-dependent M28 family amino/carboxypeptidase
MITSEDVTAAFDEVGATQSARELATQFPNRTPGSPTAADAADWVAERLASFGFRVQRDRFQGDVPDQGQVELENVIAVSPGRSPDVLVVMAHRDNRGTTGQGANDNASGTASAASPTTGCGCCCTAASRGRLTGPRDCEAAHHVSWRRAG